MKEKIMLNYQNDYLKQFNDTEIIIYGAGYVGKLMTDLFRYNNMRIKGVCDRRAHEIAERYENMGIPIRTIEEWIGETDTTILIATGEMYHDQIISACKREGFNNIFIATKPMINAALRCVFEKYFAQKGISCEEDSIDLGFIKVDNALLYKDLDAQYLYLAEMSDFIMPNIDASWDYINEGLYDWGKTSLHKGDVVLDCGANVGLFSVYAALKGCDCISFEPLAQLHNQILQLCELNNVNVNIVQAAVSNKTGSAAFDLGGNYTRGSLVNNQGDSIIVQQTTIDRFVEENELSSVDFIKADIEGAERLMLEGAQKTLARFAPKLSLCTYHRPDDKEVLSKLILNANPKYEIEYAWQKLYAYIPSD